MNKEIKKVAVYVRKSREEETEETLNRQQAVLIDLCEKNGWEWELFKEVGSSQDWEEREQLQNMLEKVQLFHFDAVVVADLDRLSRNVIHFGQIKLILVNTGCLAVTPTKVFDFTNDSDDMFSDFMSVIAKSEYQQIKKRLVRGTRQSAKSGNWLGKKAPIGYIYNRDNKRLEPSEDAPVIRKMFQLYVDGMSTKDIAYKFDNESVYTTVGMIWTPAGVTRLLSNVVYAGHSLYGKTTQKKVNGKRLTQKTEKSTQILVENTHEPLISQEMFDKVQEIKAKRNSRPVSLKLGKRKFSGLIRCGVCGNIHSFQTSRYKRKRISSCQTRNYSEDLTTYTVCENSGMNLSEFEKVFYREFEQHVKELEAHIDILREEERVETNDPHNEIDAKRKQIRKLQNDIKRVQQGFIMEIFTEEEAHKQIKQFKDQIATLEKQIDTMEQQEDNSELDYLEMRLNKMKQFLENGDDLDERQANEILHDWIETIIYKNTDSEKFIKIVFKDE